MEKELLSIPEKIRDISNKGSYSVKKERISLSLIVTFVLPTFIALWIGIFKEFLSENSGWWWGILVVLILCQLALSLILLSRKNLLADTYYYSRKLLDQIEELDREKGKKIEELEYYAISSKIQRYWAISESYLFSQDIDESEIDNELKKYFTKIFLPFTTKLGETLFGYTHHEQWNHAIYFYDSEDSKLHPFWREKSLNHPSIGIGRSWAMGQGHVGLAFDKREAIITSNAMEEKIRSLAAAPKRTRKDYDGNAYISFAAIPIMLDDDEPIGVLVATSNIKNRFTKANAQILLSSSSFVFNAWSELHKSRV